MGTQTRIDVLIIGAGISGLMAAYVLQQEGIRAAVFEKEETAGGRLATGPMGAGLADFGAQFLTAQTDEFQGWLNKWVKEGLLYAWSDESWGQGSITRGPASPRPHYAVHGGMQSLTRYLTERLDDVRTDLWLASVTPDENEWLVQDERGVVYVAKALILTPPVPQSLILLEEGASSLSVADWAALRRIQYIPSLCGVFRIRGMIDLPEPGAIYHPYAQIRWIADNQRKGISPDARVITVHTRPEYALQRWDESDTRILAMMESNLYQYLTPDTEIVESRLRRWGHAVPVVSHSERYLKAEGAPPLIFAGDAFGGYGVEAALLSGLAAGRAMVGKMTTRV